MKPETETRLPSDEELFDLLEYPEKWPDDPELQARLAEMLELHLAMQSHGGALLGEVKEPRRLKVPWMWLAASAATILPTLFAVHQAQRMRSHAKEAAQIQMVAQRRGQDRLWGEFFHQSAELLRTFEIEARRCEDNTEDRNREREMAMTLLEASHQLDAQAAPIPEAEAVRAKLQAWLLDFSSGEGCLAPERALELRTLADSHDLEGQTKRLGELLKQEGGS